jgi:hypothetical protein
MFRKAQARFVISTMTLVLALLGIIFGLFSLILRNSTVNSIHEELVNVEVNYKEHNFPTNHDYFIIKIIRIDPLTNNINYSVMDGNSSFKLQEIKDVVTYAVNKDMPFGNPYGSVFYKMSPNEKDIFCINASKIIQEKNNLIFNTGMIFIGAFVVLLLFFIFLSSKVFEPIKQSFFRQRKFISDASHELKTPIAVISANADVIKTQTKNEYLDSIKDQSERMKFLVSDMLMLSRIDEEKPTLKKEPFSLSEQVLKSAITFDAIAFENGKFIETDVLEGIEVTEDLESLTKILNILLDNAVKYATKNSKILVSLKKDGRQNVITIFNQGSLVKDQDSDKIFERFFRADDSRSRKTGGCGLGLAIAKSISDLNKWKISAKSVYGESMTITLTI